MPVLGSVVVRQQGVARATAAGEPGQVEAFLQGLDQVLDADAMRHGCWVWSVRICRISSASAAPQALTQGLVAEHARQFGEQLQVFLVGIFGHQQGEYQIDRLAIEGVELDRLGEPQKGPATLLDAGHAGVRQCHAARQTRYCPGVRVPADVRRSARYSVHPSAAGEQRAACSRTRFLLDAGSATLIRSMSRIPSGSMGRTGLFSLRLRSIRGCRCRGGSSPFPCGE